MDEVQAIAEAFHDAYEIHAAGEGWETQKASRTTFDDLPEANKQTMLKTVQTLLDNGVITPGALHPWSFKKTWLQGYDRGRETKEFDERELLFFATYIGPLVIGLSPSVNDVLEAYHNGVRIGTKLAEE